MRITILILTLAVLFMAAHSLARGADEDGGDARALQRRVQALEHQVAYLLSREADLTAYLLTHETVGADVEAAVTAADRQGFTQGAIPTDSRVSLLEGLRAFGRALQKGLPEITKKQKEILEAAARLR